MDRKDLFKELAQKCGELIGKSGYDLVYGGSSRGLMGITAKAAARNGAKVIGVFPTALCPDDKDLYHKNGKTEEPSISQYETLNTSMDEVIFVDNMFERKARMFELSDIFITLPGGLGTIDEFFEMFTIKSLGWHNKEIILVNHDNHWDSMIEMIDQLIDVHFASKSCKKLFETVESVEDAFDYIKKTSHL